MKTLGIAFSALILSVAASAQQPVKQVKLPTQTVPSERRLLQRPVTLPNYAVVHEAYTPKVVKVDLGHRTTLVNRKAVEVIAERR